MIAAPPGPNVAPVAGQAPAAGQVQEPAPAQQPKHEPEQLRSDKTYDLGSGRFETRPPPLMAEKPKQQQQHVYEAYEQRVQRLEPLIKAQLEVVYAQAPQLRPQPAAAAQPQQQPAQPQAESMVLALDVTHATRMLCDPCLASARKNNPNVNRVDFIDDTAVIFSEVSKRLGGKYGIVAYDENNVYTVRDLNGAGGGNLGGKLHSILDAREKGKPVEGVPTTPAAGGTGGANDRAALDAAMAMLGKDGGNVIFAKGNVPSQSLKSLEGVAAGGKVKLRGLAFGERANAVAAGMFTGTKAVSSGGAGLKTAIGSVIASAQR